MVTQVGIEAFKTDGTFYPANSWWDDPPKFPAVVLVYADFCGHCHKFMPVFDKVAANASDTIGFYKVDGVAAQVPGIQGYPTVLVFPTATSTAFMYEGPRDVPSFWRFLKEVYSATRV